MKSMWNEDWDLWEHTKVTLPARSRLFHLEPAGIGTGLVESLASYSSRLAAAHNVTHASLFGHEISPLIDRQHLRNSETRLDRGSILAASFRTLARAVNGTGITAKDYASALEKLTGRDDLRYLTMTIWTNVVPHRNLLKPFKEWCPSCYEKARLGETPIYEPLLWSFSAISVCVAHRLRLSSLCPSCDQSIPYIDSHSKPGFCSKCNGWLGQLSQEDIQFVGNVNEEFEWQRWVTEQLSILLTSGPLMGVIPKKEAVTESIRFCIKNIANMPEACFARTLGVPQSTVNDWQRQGKMPRLEKLLQIARLARIPLLNLLLGITPDQQTPDEITITPSRQQNFRQPLRHSEKRTRIDTDKSKKALEAALTAEITPSFHEVARTLSCSSTALMKHFPELCRNLSEKYKSWRKEEWTKIEVEIEKALVSDPPRSIKAIAKDLNRNYTSLQHYFPELCRRITQRYEAYLRACQEQKKETLCQEIRRIVKALYQAGVYPSVKQVEASLSQQRTIRYSKMALATLRQAREEFDIPTAPNNFIRFVIS